MMEEDKESRTYSIALHLRRVIHEDAFISVPVTHTIIKVTDDGTHRIDVEALWAEGIRIGESEGVEWKVEESKTEPHPIQCPLPEGRRSFNLAFPDPDTVD